MRTSLAFSFVVMSSTVAACGGADEVQCVADENCNRFSGGECTVNAATGNKWCTYPDETCPSGRRWSDLDVGDGLSGLCVDGVQYDAAIDATPTPDGSTECESAGGVMTFQTDRDGDLEIARSLASGTSVELLTMNTAEDYRGVWSPDGTKIAWQSEQTGDAEIFVMNADGSSAVNVTNDADRDDGEAGSYAWSPDSAMLVFASRRNGSSDLFVVNADGTGLMQITTSTAGDFAPSWSPGSRIAFVSTRDGNAEIYTVNADGTGQTNLTAATGSDTVPKWSPDGTRVAFLSTRSGSTDIWTMSATGASPVNLTDDAVTQGLYGWSPDGTKLLYFELTEVPNDGNIWTITVSDTSRLNLTAHTGNAVLNTDAVWSPDGARVYFATNRDDSRDGNREIYSVHADGSQPTNLTNNEADDGYPAVVSCP